MGRGVIPVHENDYFEHSFRLQKKTAEPQNSKEYDFTGQNFLEQEDRSHSPKDYSWSFSKCSTRLKFHNSNWEKTLNQALRFSLKYNVLKKCYSYFFSRFMWYWIFLYIHLHIFSLFFIKVRYQSSLSCLKEVVAREGAASLYRGAGVNIIRGVAGAGVLSGFDKLKQIYISRQNHVC